MVHQPEVPDPETASADSFGKAEPIDVITDSTGAVTGVKAKGESIENLKWICSYEANEYYFWTSEDTGTRKQMFISSDPKGGIKIYPETRSVKYTDHVMSAKAKTGINYVFFKDTPDAKGLQFTGVLKEDGQKPDASYNTSIYLLKVAGKDETTKKVKNTAVKIMKPKTGKKKATAKWKANKLFDGYQVWYKMKAKGKKWKKVAVKGASKNKKDLKKLKKGKKYQIKVRGYKTIDGKKVYGKFSKTKTTGKIK